MRWSLAVLTTSKELTLSFIHTPAPPSLSFLAVCLSNITPQLPGELASPECEWGAGLTSVHCADAWPGLVYHFWGLFIRPTHTHTAVIIRMERWGRGGWLLGRQQLYTFKSTRACSGSGLLFRQLKGDALIDTQTCTHSPVVEAELSWSGDLARCRVRILRTVWTAMCN